MKNMMVLLILVPIEINCLKYKGDRIIIKSEEDYETLYNPNTFYEPCQNYTLPIVDFNKLYTNGNWYYCWWM